MNFDYIDINSNPLKFIKNSKKKDIIQVLKNADNAFFNSDEPLLTDDIYDIIKDYIKKKIPQGSIFKTRMCRCRK